MAIKHEPKFYVRFCTHRMTFPGDFLVYPGSIYGRYNDAKNTPIFWVCDCYSLVGGKLPVHVFNGSYWKLTLCEKSHPCYEWVKYAINKLGKIPVVSRERLNVESLMKHDRVHKKGSGSRINTHQINNPLQWREVTEIAHWYGKGNASVVANNMR